tara:strand:+ start:4992 stop:5099 length:108 start_codon:yes stop_codon:yes gene_type:complete
MIIGAIKLKANWGKYKAAAESKAVILVRAYLEMMA